MAAVHRAGVRRPRQPRPRRQADARPAARRREPRPRTRSSGCSARPARWTSPRSGCEFADGELPDLAMWAYPDTWLDGDHAIEVGTRTLDAVHTPGHTPGPLRVRRPRRPGCSSPATTCCRRSRRRSASSRCRRRRSRCGDFMASLTKVRGLPDLRLLPAHGPVAPSSHARVDELLALHEDRLDAVPGGARRRPGDRRTTSPASCPGPGTSTALDDLDVFNAALASMETKAHLELLVARGQATREVTRRGRAGVHGRPTARLSAGFLHFARGVIRGTCANSLVNQ